MKIDTSPTLCSEQCRQARLARDVRFDGRFFTGVFSTGIYCRPVCPATPPKEKNVGYFPSAAAAEQAGLRPCLRCRPELAPLRSDWRAHQPRLHRAVQLLLAGEASSIAELAERSFVSERQLRRLFVQHLGAAPLQLLATQRLLNAKRLLTETAMAVTDVAYASGFASVRRFNDAFVAAYRLSPSDFRRQQGQASSSLTLRLPYRPPLDYPAMLAFFAKRAVTGLEWVEQDSYYRRLGPDSEMRIAPGRADELTLTLSGVEPANIPAILQRVRRMWDLDAEPSAVLAPLSADPVLAASLEQHPGVRLPTYWSGWEALVRAVIGQQVSVAGAVTLVGRLVARNQAAGGWGLPSPEQLQQLDLTGLGMPTARIAALQRVAELGPAEQFEPWQDPDAISTRLLALKGIGPWTVNYWRLRSGADPDAFPATDGVLVKQAEQLGLADNSRQLDALSARWQPWRGYAASLIWQGQS
ncbi:DNA-3-methyladenine glycosylase 2 family protein [Ferrimonas marina]|uniref:DNA-3-methyladenine glycosylase II n=1 Tax=Ferrimonas marina TaxID=299255 RepID=A0A1M5Z4N2_9GAMM|nr:AlkA N-terminal domain-containing protein [Ferrimonas marina]SHI19212.1 DNA-3-methyladenine glycosylase II [Ferrimonas marina]